MKGFFIRLFIIAFGITLTSCSTDEFDDDIVQEEFPTTMWGKIEYIKIGDDYERVKEILGQVGNVDGRDETPWLYYWIIPHNDGNVLIEFEQSVVKSIEINWVRGNRNELAFKLTNEYISGLSLGSTEEDVISVLGTPDEKRRKVSTNRTVDEYVYYRGDYRLKLEILMEGYFYVRGEDIIHVKKTKLDIIKLIKH